MMTALLLAAVLCPGEVDVVTAPDACSVVRFAADELAGFVGKSLGCEVPVVTSFSEGRTSLVVGTNAWSRAAGVCPERLPRDGFVVRSLGNRVYVAGCDSPKTDMKALLGAKSQWPFQHGERASVFAVYGFLERYAGVRFYWPGEMGTVVPRHGSIEVPEGEWTCAPDFTVREPSFASPLQYLRLRAQTKYTPCAHGLAALSLRERFSGSHPEYFALRKGPDGRLVREPEMSVPESHAGQLCWTSDALWEQIHADAVAYFSGVSAKDHGVPGHYSKKGWSWGNGWYGEYFDVMGQDGFQPCLCDGCQAAYSKTDRDQYATELVWSRTAALANRLLREGVKGTLTQMAYPPYRHVPGCDIPTNVLVMVSERGPWNEGNPDKARQDDDEVRAWARKLGRKVWLWTYPGKFGALQLDDVPQMTPRAHGAYFTRLAPFIFGAKTESETDRPVYNYLNDYVAAKVAWDVKTDVVALLDEHDRLMFGAAADEMRGFYGLLEDKWIREIAGRTKDTAVGPIALAPSPLELWTRIYSPETLDRCEDFFARARAKLDPKSDEARRVAWIKAEFCDPLVRRGRRIAAGFDAGAALRRRAAGADGRNLLPEDGETGWQSWPSGRLTAAADASAPTPGACLHLVSTERSYATHALKGLLETGRTYRVSMFLRGRGIEPFSTWDGGLNVEISDGRRKWRHPFPNGNNGVGFTGTFGWVHVAFDFTVGPELGETPYLAVRLANCTGEAWFDAPYLSLSQATRESGSDGK